MTASDQAAREPATAEPPAKRLVAETAGTMLAMFRDPAVTMEFNEAAYLAAFSDVQVGIAAGRFESAWAHWRSHGVAEDRLTHPTYLAKFGLRPGRTPPTAGATQVDMAYVGEAGHVLVIGWADDTADPLASVSLEGRPGFNSFAITRFRRKDVEEGRELLAGDYGFVAMLRLLSDQLPDGGLRLRLRRASGASSVHEVRGRPVSDAMIVQQVLDHIGRGPTIAPFYRSAFAGFETGLGETLIALSRNVSDCLVANPLVLRHGKAAAAPRVSVIVCLYGKTEWLFVQSALFAATHGMENVEFIYVCNSPELAGQLDRELRIAATAYGLDQRLVVLGGNAGFAAACNAGAALARSDRLIFANPDLLPRDPDWLATHQDILDGFPEEATKLFGGLLYYDDGALMHGGMFIETDLVPAKDALVPMLRVEHYGKGFPPNSPRFTRARPVTAVSGALVCMDRAWFEALGGFSADYVYGHYEDADLCLRSLQRGVAPWVHALPFWHLEGKGAAHPAGAAAASALNRWLFTKTWQAAIADGLEGSRPTNPAFQTALAEAAA